MSDWFTCSCCGASLPNSTGGIHFPHKVSTVDTFMCASCLGNGLQVIAAELNKAQRKAQPVFKSIHSGSFYYVGNSSKKLHKV